MTDEERQAMIQFFGTVHAQAKQTDQMIIGQSNCVKPISPSIQNNLTTLLQRGHTQEHQQHTVEQSVPHHQPVFAPVQLQHVEDTTHIPNIKDQLQEINNTLLRIADILEQKYEKKSSSKRSQ